MRLCVFVCLYDLCVLARLHIHTQGNKRFPCDGFFIQKMSLSWESWYGEGGSKIENVHVCFGSLLMRNASRRKMCDKTTSFCFCTFHIDACHMCLKSFVVGRILRAKWSFRTRTLCHRKMAPAPANPAGVRALLIRMCRGTRAGSRWMFEKTGAAG